jgi:hypothetical protein
MDSNCLAIILIKIKSHLGKLTTSKMLIVKKSKCDYGSDFLIRRTLYFAGEMMIVTLKIN